jgi:DNA-binding transcriptional LysR family regulator
MPEAVMEMHQIRYVLAAARTLNFTKAASECNVSQPALTKAIRALETELGGPLFHREGKRMLLSEFGRSLLPHLRNILEEAQVTSRWRTIFASWFRSPSASASCRLSDTSASVASCRAFQKEHDGVEVAVSESHIADLKEKLSTGDLDVAVLNPAEGLGEGFHAIDLYAERYLVILPPDHRLARQNVIELKDLSGHPYVDRLACEMREMVTAGQLRHSCVRLRPSPGRADARVRRETSGRDVFAVLRNNEVLFLQGRQRVRDRLLGGLVALHAEGGKNLAPREPVGFLDEFEDRAALFTARCAPASLGRGAAATRPAALRGAFFLACS